MGVTRRRFLTMAGVSAMGAVIFGGCRVPDREVLIQSPARLPEDLVTGIDNWYASTCHQCPAGCGILVRVMEGRAKKIEGNPDHPLNHDPVLHMSKTCARGQAGVQLLYHPDRIQGPMRRDRATGELLPISWEEARAELVGRLRELRDRGASDTVLVVTEPLRGHLGLLAREFVKAYGGQHMAFEALEETVLREAVKRVFDQDRLPDLDLANAEYVISFGSGFLETWLSPVRYGVAYGHLRQGREAKRGYFVQVEPRLSATGANADDWVYVKPGMEGLLALSMAYVIVSQGLGDQEASRLLTRGQGAQYLAAYRPQDVAGAIGTTPEKIEELALDFAAKRPSLAIGGGSAAAHTNGLFNLTAIYSLNYLVGSVGQRGGILFNPAPPVAGLPVAEGRVPFDRWQELTGRLASGKPRPVNLVVFRGANPVHSLPQALGFADALKNVPFIVSFSTMMDETAAMADLILPEHTYLEDWGDDLPEPGPGYEVVSYQQPVVRPFHNTHSFGDELIMVAKELGGSLAQAMPWNSFKEVLQAGARKLFELNRGSVTAPDFDSFWRGVLQRGGWWDTARRGLARPLPKPLPVREDPQFTAGEYHLLPFASISLTEGRGAALPWLQATPDPMTTAVWQTWAEISLEDARKLGVSEGDFLEITSSNGTSLEAPAYPNPAAPPGIIAMPLGQGHSSLGRYAENRGVNTFMLLQPATEKETKALAWAATRVTVRNTGRRSRISKFEGSVRVEALHEVEIVRVTKG
ncbi:MAG: molybdopterin-dependent oxidoreductase [Chloroflexi bacterium]|nr:molybdopterin-dependent oxidoreductase [Chloroflexota bacterium]